MSAVPVEEQIVDLRGIVSPSGFYARRRQPLREIVIHRIAIYEDEKHKVEQEPGAATIERFHQSHRDISGGHIPYHEVITREQVQLAIPFDRIGYHARSPFNERSYAIAVWGNFQRRRNERPTDFQLVQVVERAAVVAMRARIEFGRWPEVRGHTELNRDWRGHVCPGALFPMDDIRERVSNRILDLRQLLSRKWSLG